MNRIIVAALCGHTLNLRADEFHAYGPAAEQYCLACEDVTGIVLNLDNVGKWDREELEKKILEIT